jgi:hypothetical protein
VTRSRHPQESSPQPFRIRLISLLIITLTMSATQYFAALPASADIVDYPTNYLGDGGFEHQPARTISTPWYGEGPDFKGIDINLNLARRGTNNAFIRTSSRNWNALAQRASVPSNTTYRVTAWVRSSANLPVGYIGARSADGTQVLGQTPFWVSNPGWAYQRITADFNTGANTSIIVFVGYQAPGADSWIQIDDVFLGGAYSNWAGYVVFSGGNTPDPITRVTTFWTEPNVTCRSPRDKLSIWVGIDGTPGPLDSFTPPLLSQPRPVNESLMQTGSFIDCSSGSPVHRGFWEVINPWVTGDHTDGSQFIGGPIQAGDRMSAGVSSPNPSSFTLVVSNVTRVWSAIATVYVPAAQRASGEAIAESPTCTPPCTWPSFSAVFFDTTLINGQPIGAFGPVAVQAIDNRDNRPIAPVFYNGNADFAVWKP